MQKLIIILRIKNNKKNSSKLKPKKRKLNNFTKNKKII